MSERMTVEWLEETLYLMNHIETDAEHYAKFHREIVVAFSALRASEAALSARVKVLEAAMREIAAWHHGDWCKHELTSDGACDCYVSVAVNALK